jgi:AcrR family transcriptional regulator
VTPEHRRPPDPKRSIELLWRLRDPPPRRGPKPRFSAHELAHIAIQIADSEGLAALSMRRVADQLGVTAMSLYTYVPGKTELLDLMLDTVCGEAIDRDSDGIGWRAKLEVVARQSWAIYRRHPWMLQVGTMNRPVLGPNVIAKYDRELRAIDGVGLDDIEMDSVVALIANYVHGAARGAVDTTQAERSTGMTDEQWWSASAPVLEKVFDVSRYPTAARVGAAAGAAYGAAYDPDHAFEFGLQRILDGIEAFIGKSSM